MSPKNTLHRIVFECLSKLDLTDHTLIGDDACGGNQRIPLYPGNIKVRGGALTDPDIIILAQSAVRLIVEVEEEHNGHGFSPHRITGKFYTAGLCHYYVPGAAKAAPVPLAAEVTFIQVLNTTGMNTKSRKPEQYDRIAAAISSSLPFGCMHDYHVIAGTLDEFLSGAKRDDLCRDVSSAIGTSRPHSLLIS
jgi:hypothetical protein